MRPKNPCVGGASAPYGPATQRTATGPRFLAHCEPRPQSPHSTGSPLTDVYRVSQAPTPPLTLGWVDFLHDFLINIKAIPQRRPKHNQGRPRRHPPPRSVGAAGGRV